MSKRKRRKRPPKPILSIIIPVYGRFDILSKCLDAIPEAVGDTSYEVIVVDNATPEQEKQPPIDFQGIRLIPLKRNHGFPYACNIGAKRSGGSVLFFLNSDIILQPGSVGNLLEEIAKPDIGVVGMKLLFPEDAEGLKPEVRPAGKVQHVGLSTNVRGEFVHHLIGWSSNNPRVNAVWEVYAVTGAALMIQRKIWIKAKGFFLGYGQGCYEDMDLCLTVRELGYNVVVRTDAVGVHYTGATAEKYQIPYPMEYNRMTFMQRWAHKLNYTEYMVL